MFSLSSLPLDDRWCSVFFFVAAFFARVVILSRLFFLWEVLVFLCFLCADRPCLSFSWNVFLIM